MTSEQYSEGVVSMLAAENWTKHILNSIHSSIKKPAAIDK